MRKNILPIKLIIVIIVLLLFLSLASCYCDKNTVCQNDTVEIGETGRETEIFSEKEITTYILNVKSKKIHKVSCGTGDLISSENRRAFEGEIEDLFGQGYTTCGNCFK